MDIDINPRVLNLLTKQINRLSQESLEGIKTIINEDNFLDVQVEITGPEGTPYQGGIFKCKLEFPNDFPSSPPKGYFLTKIFHPNISTGGEVCVNTLKKDWNQNNWSLTNIFNVIRCLLIQPFPESALNEEAGRMFMEDYHLYFKHAQMYTQIMAMPKQQFAQTKRPQTHLEMLKKWLRRS